MEIPEELKLFLNLDKAEARIDVASMLVNPEKKGAIIDFANLIEEAMDRFLAFRVTKGDATASLRNKAVFAEKIAATATTLETIAAHDVNHEPHIEFSQCIRELRNAVAHNTGMSSDEVMRLADLPLVAELANRFPDSCWDRLKVLENHLAKYHQ